MVAQHQVHQVFLLTAGVGGDAPQGQVPPQVLHLEAHELRPLEGRLAQQVAGAAAAEVLVGDRAHGTEVLLAITAHMLLSKD